MDDLEFQKRLYSNPRQDDPEILDSVASNASHAELYQQVKSFESQAAAIMHSSEIPQDLLAKLKSIPAQEKLSAEMNKTAPSLQLISNQTQVPLRSRYTRQYALAASLLLALGIGFFFNINDPSPSAIDIALGNEIIEHLHIDFNASTAIGANNNASLQLVSQVLNQAGLEIKPGRLNSETEFYFAQPCVILAAYRSAHLVVLGSQGPINIFLINNSPVSQEFLISDERFDGVVVPLAQGNLILVGEHDEDLEQFRDLFSSELEWIS